MKRWHNVHLVLIVLAAGLISSCAQQARSTTHAHMESVTSNAGNSYRLEVQNSDPTLNTYIANAQEEFASCEPTSERLGSWHQSTYCWPVAPQAWLLVTHGMRNEMT